ncbi:hypothetical protein JTB14_009010 [Gonioctena quinquepunctata]|nr:hypothetical protein JTB14_009010 [Gonioctena quinquepunctata]
MKTSKSVLLLLIFLTTTTYGFLQNDRRDTSRRADTLENNVFNDRRQIRNNVKKIEEKDRVFENLYDRRSFRTGTPETTNERRVYRDSNNNRRQLRNSFAEWRDNRVNMNDRQHSSVDRNQIRENTRDRNFNVNERFGTRNEIRRQISMERRINSRSRESESRRVTATARTANPSMDRQFRADLSRSDSARQMQQDARSNYGSDTEMRRNVVPKASLSFRNDEFRTDSTRHLRRVGRINFAREEINRQNALAQEQIRQVRTDMTRRSSNIDQRRNVETRISETRLNREYVRNSIRNQHGPKSNRNNFIRDLPNFRNTGRDVISNRRRADNNRESNYREPSRRDQRNIVGTQQMRITTMRDDIRTSQTRNNESRFYMTPQRRTSTLKEVRYLPQEDILNKSQKDFKLEMGITSWINAAQVILSIYLIGQIFVNSSMKNKPRLLNTLSAVGFLKEKAE